MESKPHAPDRPRAVREQVGLALDRDRGERQLHAHRLPSRGRPVPGEAARTDAKAFRDGVGRLRAEVQRIKSEGDYDAARTLFETYGIHFDPGLRDEILARAAQLDLPAYTGFVMPRLEPFRGPDGRITDVSISYPMDLTRQMLEYSANRPSHLECQP